MTARKVFGLAFCGAGALLLSFAGGRYAMGAVRADSARSQWDEAQAHMAVVHAREAARSHGPRVDPVAGAPVARIEIPRIGLDDIVLEGVGGDELNADPGHFPGSVLPGERGNAIISAHRDRHFNRVGELVTGDTIITESDAGRHTWVLTGQRIVEKNEPALFQTKDPTLTLTTCWPIRYFGPAPERLILTAKEAR